MSSASDAEPLHRPLVMNRYHAPKLLNEGSETVSDNWCWRNWHWSAYRLVILDCHVCLRLIVWCRAVCNHLAMIKTSLIPIHLFCNRCWTWAKYLRKYLVQKAGALEEGSCWWSKPVKAVSRISSFLPYYQHLTVDTWCVLGSIILASFLKFLSRSSVPPWTDPQRLEYWFNNHDTIGMRCESTSGRRSRYWRVERGRKSMSVRCRDRSQRQETEQLLLQ